jgi:lipopolysaccharide export LptBFGC system permease protein LptF
MRILDRYILLTFLKNYALSLLVLLGMYITLDLVINFDEVFRIDRDAAVPAGGLENAVRAVANVVDFYFYQAMLIFVQLAPIIPVVAAAFTLLRMNRFNELVATLAAGQSLHRMARMILVAGLGLILVTLVFQEVIIPASIPKLLRKHDEVGSDSRRSFPVRALEDARGNILIAANFQPATSTVSARMLEVDLLIRDTNRLPTAHVLASAAAWDAEHHKWLLTNGRLVTGLLPDQRRGPDTPVPTLDTSLTPEEITLYRSREFVELLPTSRINELLAQPRNYGVTDLLRVRNFRFAQYFNNFFLLMLAVSCVMTREPRTLKTGGTVLLVAVGANLGLIFFAQHLAGTPPPLSLIQSFPALPTYWPALMAFLPILIFGPLAVYTFDRIRT